jgi:hypothetical protein
MPKERRDEPISGYELRRSAASATDAPAPIILAPAIIDALAT